MPRPRHSRSGAPLITPAKLANTSGTSGCASLYPMSAQLVIHSTGASAT